MTIATTPATTITNGLISNPWGIAFDTSGKLWVASLGNDSIEKFSTAGNLLAPTINETPFSHPSGLAIDSAGNLWVANSSDGTVNEFSSVTGLLMRTLGGLSSPRGLAFDSSGDLWVSNSLSNTVVEFSASTWTMQQTLATGSSPSGLVFDSSGDLWVSNYLDNTIMEISGSSGTVIRTLASGLNGPMGLAFDASGDLWVANTLDNTIQEIATSTGGLMQRLSSGLVAPRGLAFDTYGNLWVTNYFGNTIQEFLNISPTPSDSSTITVGGQLLTQQTVSGNSTITSGSSSVITYGNLQANGGAAQNNPLSTQNTSETTAGAAVTLPQLMAVKTQKIKGLLSAVTTEMAEAMTRGVSGSATDSTKIAGSSMIAPPDSNLAVESIAPPSDVPMESIAYPVYGYNYFYLSDFQGSSNFRVTSTSGNLVTTNLLELINNNGGNQNVDIAGYQGIVVATPGVNVTGLTVNNYLGTFGGGSYTFGAGNQKLFLMGPNSNITGGGGIDTVRFLGVGQGGVNITQQGNEVQIWSDWLDTGSGVTYMHNVARAQFDDGSVAFDTGAGQNAGQVFRLYEAAFHRAGDQQGIGYWLNQIDNGTSLNTIANQFLSSQEFINLYGSSPSNNQFITALYNNVLGRAPDAAGLNYWLSTGLNKAQLLIEFAESPEGVAHVSGQMAQGVQYQQWVQ